MVEQAKRARRRAIGWMVFHAFVFTWLVLSDPAPWVVLVSATGCGIGAWALADAVWSLRWARLQADLNAIASALREREGRS